MTLRKMVLANYDPVNPGTSVPSVDSSHPCFGVVLPASQGTIEAFDNRALSDPIRRQQFRFVMLAAKELPAGVVPLNNDQLVTAEGVYRVLGSTPLNPNGTQPIMYNVGCTTDLQV